MMSVQVEEMYRRMVFNLVCDNKDDHAKNFSFICRDGVWSLAPAYDITYSSDFLHHISDKYRTNYYRFTAGIKPLRGFFPTSAGHHQNWSKSAFCLRRIRFFWYSSAYESELSTLRISKKSHNQRLRDLLRFVIRLGFEPKTHSLEGCCSIQLSYRTRPFWIGVQR